MFCYRGLTASKHLVISSSVVCHVCKTAVSTSQKTLSVSIINISGLNLFKEVSDIFYNRLCTLCGRTVELSRTKPCGKYSNHYTSDA